MRPCHIKKVKCFFVINARRRKHLSYTESTFLTIYDETATSFMHNLVNKKKEHKAEENVVESCNQGKSWDKSYAQVKNCAIKEGKSTFYF